MYGDITTRSIFSWIHEDDRIINYVWGRILKLDIESIKHKKWKKKYLIITQVKQLKDK